MSRKIQQRSYGGPEVLEVVPMKRPDPGALARGQVLVRVSAAGVNPVDTQTRRGEAVAGQMGGFPFTVGWDVAGTVEALGPDTGPSDAGEALAVGERVLAFSRFPAQAAAYADYAVVAVDELARIPASLPDVAAAGLPLAGLTAWQDLVDVAEVRPGQRVLVQGGGGGVGHLAVQIAHDLGAHVIATTSASKRDWVTGLGADEVIVHPDDSVAEVLRDSPVDVVLDAVGGPVGLSSIAVTKGGGVVVALPGVSEDMKAAADGAGVRAVYHAVHPDGAQLAHLLSRAEAGALAVVVSDVFSLERAADAHRAVEGGHTRGKVVLSL